MNEWQRRKRRRNFMWFIFMLVWLLCLIWLIRKEDKYRGIYHQDIFSDK